MPIIRKVFGPFAPEETRVILDGKPTTQELRWYFFGIRGDGEMSHWVLTYTPKTRKFLASNTGKPSLDGRRNRMGLRSQGIEAEAGPCIHPKMFIEGDATLTQEGNVTDILKSKLSAADIARATALAITRR
ncbi:hypothetical protein PMI07_000852 [Rhizobium sp. CF080]|uniref:hypothetical protein n=1 Tax=Rhizobium sp. (strain CF080) TaxID=1144310 RepID=UPI000271ACE2|nr:hypothetical protein [Rhizobium sp. CF080]EUB97276.1 hypothetical protein PMI07_000852 [Rhizobium sp. CF080]